MNIVFQIKVKLYHFDFYRLKDEAEAFDIGYEEYFWEMIIVLLNGQKIFQI